MFASLKLVPQTSVKQWDLPPKTTYVPVCPFFQPLTSNNTLLQYPQNKYCENDAFLRKVLDEPETLCLQNDPQTMKVRDILTFCVHVISTEFLNEQALIMLPVYN